MYGKTTSLPRSAIAVSSGCYRATAMKCNARYCEGLSVRPFVCSSNACIVTKFVSIFLNHMNGLSSWFSDKKKTAGGGDPLYLKFWAKLTLLERKRLFLIDIRS